MSMNKSIKDIALSWILKEKEGLTLIEKKQLESFLENSENKKYYDKYKLLLLDCNDFDEDEKSSIKELIQEDKSKSKLKFLLAPLAASIIFAFFFAFNYYDNSLVKYENIYTSLDKKRLDIILPDDSSVDLDIKSKIDVKYYNEKRVVNLESGKAIFSVQKDENRPFIINNKKMKIEVLGTKFEVVNLNNVHIVNVIEGLVRVSYKYPNKTKDLIVLQKGQTFSLDEEGKIFGLKDINTSNIAMWKDDLVKFENSTLKEALDEFARYNDLRIVLKDYKISQFKISGIFNLKKSENFLDSLPEIYPLKVKKEKNIISLYLLQ